MANNAEMIRLLIRHGAKVNESGALLTAAEQGHVEVVRRFENGADVTSTDMNGQTAMETARDRKRNQAMVQILERGLKQNSFGFLTH